MAAYHILHYSFVSELCGNFLACKIWSQESMGMLINCLVGHPSHKKPYQESVDWTINSRFLFFVMFLLWGVENLGIISNLNMLHFIKREFMRLFVSVYLNYTSPHLPSHASIYSSIHSSLQSPNHTSTHSSIISQLILYLFAVY